MPQAPGDGEPGVPAGLNPKGNYPLPQGKGFLKQQEQKCHTTQ
jgi:hypothetical protein